MFASGQSKILTLRLEDFEDNDNKNLSIVMQTRKIKERNFPIQIIFMNKLWNLKRWR